jgi:Domain of Unknown Function (DUF1259)
VKEICDLRLPICDLNSATVKPRFANCDWKRLVVLLIGSLVMGCAAESDAPTLVLTARPAAVAATAPAEASADPAWGDIAKVLERKGVVKDGVYVVTVPRDDLDVTIEGMGIPTAAGIESVFYFYRCPCGKMNVAGQFVTADYEANDVADALRQGQLKITSIGPLLLYEKPRLLVVRFQAEGDAVLMAKALREALRWTAAERMAPQKLEGDK